MEIMNSVFKPNINILLCGDFNVDSYKPSNDFKKLCNVLSSFNLNHMVGWPTRVTSSTSTTIDQIFSNCTMNGVTCVLYNYISDHRTILFDLRLEKGMNIGNRCYIKRSFIDTAISNFRTGIQNEDWSDLYHINDINSALDYFLYTFLYYFNVHFPKRKYDKNNKHDKNWVNDSVKASSLKLKDLFVLKNTYPDLKSTYKIEKKKHNILINSTKKLYYQNKINNSDNPTRSAWKIVAELSNRKKYSKTISIMNNGDLIENQKEVAAAFNTFFINAPINILKQISQNGSNHGNIDIFSNNIIP